MKIICYAKSASVRMAFVRTAWEARGRPPLRYLAPKKFGDDIRRRLPEAQVYAYEDVTKHNDLLNQADDRTLLVFDRASRYKNITSQVFVRLSRIAAHYPKKLLVDIVPFTGGIESLYCPLAFLDRTILGWQHWYSFRENNWELDARGQPRRAHDIPLLAEKLAPWTVLDYRIFLDQSVQQVAVPWDAEDQAGYHALRDRLFAEHHTASPIITALADWTNIRPHRYARLRALLTELTGRIIMYTNLAGHNRRLQKQCPGVPVKSFYDTNGGEDQYDHVILAELPIVKTYLFLDVIANVRPDCRIWILRSAAPVETYLWQKMSGEYDQINALTRHLAEEVLV